MRRRAYSSRRMHAEAERAVERWNREHPIGTRVAYRSDPHAAPRETATRSVAWIICDHASVLVEGISGGVALDALTVLEVTPCRT